MNSNPLIRQYSIDYSGFIISMEIEAVWESIIKFDALLQLNFTGESLRRFLMLPSEKIQLAKKNRKDVE